MSGRIVQIFLLYYECVHQIFDLGEDTIWACLGVAAIITALMNIVTWAIGKEEKYYRFVSISLTALTMCAFYNDGAKRVAVEDWDGLMDIMPTMSTALWVCVIVSILINGSTLFIKKK